MTIHIKFHGLFAKRYDTSVYNQIFIFIFIFYLVRCPTSYIQAQCTTDEGIKQI